MLLNYLLNSWKIGVTIGTFLTKVLFLIVTDILSCSFLDHNFVISLLEKYWVWNR